MKFRHVFLLTGIALSVSLACGSSDDSKGGGDGDRAGDGDSGGDGDGDSAGDGDAGDGDTGDGDAGDGDAGDGDAGDGDAGDGDAGDGDAGPGGSGAGGAGGASNATGGSNGGNPLADMTCKQLQKEAAVALEAAQSCAVSQKPAEELCSTSVTTLCGCEVPVGLSTSNETTYYKRVMSAYEKKSCIGLCPLILCEEFSGGVCDKSDTCVSDLK